MPLDQLTEEPIEEEAVLKDEDEELKRVLSLLSDIHVEFYEAERPKEEMNVQVIIPEMKSQILGGVNLLFSGVIPLDLNPPNTEIWKLSEQFGAKCWSNLNKHVTHVIAAKVGLSFPPFMSAWLE